MVLNLSKNLCIFPVKRSMHADQITLNRTELATSSDEKLLRAMINKTLNFEASIKSLCPKKRQK